MSIEYTTLSVELFTEGPDGWQTVTGLLNDDHVSPTLETIGPVIDMFDGWLAANPGADDAQFNWRLFEFCIIADNKARAATALQTAIDKGKALSAEELVTAQAKIA